MVKKLFDVPASRLSAVMGPSLRRAIRAKKGVTVIGRRNYRRDEAQRENRASKSLIVW